MSAPPLPEVFGNYALGEFVEVVSPPGINWWPQTVAWQVLGLLLLVLLARRAWRGLRRWYRDRYRREARAALQQLSANSSAELSASDINRLLKLTALVPFPREQVAALSGRPWVDFLNEQCPQAPFGPDQAELLAEGVYRELRLVGAAGESLLAACETWIREHRDPRGV